MTLHPRLALIALGGTIASESQAEGGYVPTSSASDLLNQLAQHSSADVRAIEMFRVPSRELTPPLILEVARRITKEIDRGACGIIVTQGTDTIEETAYLLSLVLPRKVPIVVTGAMRPPDALGFDGLGNLVASIAVAKEPRMSALGPVVVMNDEVHRALAVTKTHTTSLAAFVSPGAGPVARLVEGKLAIRDLPEKAHSDFVGAPTSLDATTVEIIWTAAGTGGELLESALGHAQGIVIAGLGGGHVTPTMISPLEKAMAAAIPTVLATRCLHGPVLTKTYAGVGSEIHLVKMGLLPAGTLSAVKARLRLMVALASRIDPRSCFPV